MRLSYKRLVCLGVGILIAAGLSNCEKRSSRYEKAIKNITYGHIEQYIKEFTELGDYGDSPLLLSMFKALEAGEFQQYAELYAAYSPESEPRITRGQWLYVVRDAFWQKYPLSESITDPPAYYRDLAPWYRLLALSGEDTLSYTSKICNQPAEIDLFGYDAIDELIGACGADPKGKVLVFTRDDPKADNETETVHCNIDAMAQLPEALFPYSLEEVEYTVELHYSYNWAASYGVYGFGNTKGLRNDAEVTLRRLSDKKVMHSSKITGEPLPKRIQIRSGATYYVGKISPENIERAYGDLLAALAGKATGGYSYIAGNGAAVIMSYTGQARDLVIPDNLDGCPVTSINPSAFSGNSLVSVKMPPSIERIGARAFYDCKKLSTVELPKGLLSIGDEAFANCTGLKQTEIHIPANLESYSSAAFVGCTSIRDIYFPGKMSGLVIDFGYPESTEYTKNVTIHCRQDSPAYGLVQNRGYSWTDLPED